MDRPVRAKKTVDYSQFLGDLDNDDEDFACSSVPPNKKPRVEIKKDKKEKPAKKPQKENQPSQPTSQGKRLPLDDKLYRRDLEVALALSVQKTSAVVENGEEKFGQVSPALPDHDTKDADVSFSNCSVDSSALGLDDITNGNADQVDGRSRRQAATKAIAEQRKLLADDSDTKDTEKEFNPDIAAYGHSDSESSLSGEEEEDFEFKKSSKLKANKRTKQKGAKKNQKEERTAPKPQTAGDSALPRLTIKIKLPPQRAPCTSPAPSQPALHQRSPAGVKTPKWTPPASSKSIKNSLEGVTVKSPSQGLRLGLSRFARVKPLHPGAVNN
ncbi:RAD51-associated protein 1 isoform 1-T1 [Pelodytes ibericus]